VNRKGRIESEMDENAMEDDRILDAAKACFGHLAEGFAIAGYCRKTHGKFVWKISRTNVFDSETKAFLRIWKDPENASDETRRQ
jgi:hypothetical protein